MYSDFLIIRKGIDLNYKLKDILVIVLNTGL